MKIQDGNGSSKDNGFADFTRAPQVKTDQTTNQPFHEGEINAPIEGSPEDPHSKSRGFDRLNKFKDDENFPVDTNAEDVKRLINEHLAKLGKGLRT